jgi:tripartite-type tricarboxylate transporter receptor subunit TctC
MSEDAQAYYIDLFEKVFQSEEWQTYCENEGMFCDEQVAELQGEALGAFHDEQLARHKKLIEEVGADAITSE